MSLFQTHRTVPSFSRFANVIAAESLRRGGFSSSPFQSLNLGLHTEDQEAFVSKNRSQFFGNLEISPERIVGAHQVHGNDILLVTEPGQYKGFDGFITQQKNLFLTITVADCLPVLIYDSRQEIIGAVHAGWRGTVAQITAKCLSMMSDKLDSQPKDCYAWLGTCIDECSFEVDQDVADHFAPAFKRWDEEKKKYFIHLKNANQQQLIDGGLPKDQISHSPYSTFLNNDDYFSYRKEQGKCGRMLVVIGMI